MTKFLNIRGVDDAVAAEFSAGAAIRGLTQAEYLRRLVELRKEAFHLVGARDMSLLDRDEKWVRRTAEAAKELQEFMNRLELQDHYA